MLGSRLLILAALGMLPVNAQDLAGPKLTNQTPAVVASGGGPLNSIRVTFDEPIAPASFTPADVTLYGPMGALIPVTVSAVAGSTNTQFDLGFTNQTVRGVYRLTVGPNVSDVAGNPMNQNGNVSNGEAADAYSGTVNFESIVPTLGSAPVLFSEGFESWPPVPAYWSFGRDGGSGTVTAVSSDGPKSGGWHLHFNSASFDRNLSQWAVLKLDLSGQAGATNLFLDFWAKLQSGADGASGQSFVEVSGDGQTWRQLLSFDPPTTYQNYVIDLDTNLAAGSIAMDTDVYLRFRRIRQFSNTAYHLFLDEVRITKGNPTLLLSAVPNTFPENAGSAAAYVTIKRINSTNLTDSVAVNLSEPTGAVTLLSPVTIAANAGDTNFLIGAVDDGVAAGSRQATITASAAGFTNGTATVTLLEATPAQIGLTLLGTSVSEAAGVNALSGFVTRDRGLDTNLVVSLSSSDTTELTTPLSVTIPAGSTIAVFALDTQNDGDIDGTQTVTVSAYAPGYASRSVNVEVTDDDSVGNRTIGGTLSGTISAGVYRVTSDILVNTSQTLTIASGSQLLFSSGQAVTVAGRLIADSEAGSGIVFTSSSMSPSPGDWAGIRFTGSGQTSSLLDNVEISYAQNGIGIYANDAHLTLTFSLIQSNSGDGIRVAMSYEQYIDSTDVQITGNRIRHNGANGINLYVSSTCQRSSTIYAPIIGNEIHDNGAAGIRARGDGAGGYIYCHPHGGAIIGSQISENRIHSNQIGIHAEGYTGNGGYSIISPIIENNLVVSNRADALWLKEDVYARMANNTLVGNLGSGIYHNLRVEPSPTAENNVIAGNAFGIMAATPPASTPKIWFNNVFNNAGGNWLNYPAAFGTPTTTNRNGTPADVFQNISVAPLFAGNGDFRLRLDSPCVNAGNATNAPGVDFEGEARGLLPDIGCDEVLLPPLLLSPVVLSGGQVRLTVLGESRQPFTLQGTPDLFHWADLGRYTNQSGVLVLTNVAPAGRKAYFYRTVFLQGASPSAVPAASLMDMGLLPDGRAHFQLNSAAGSAWRIQGSPDFVDWGNYGVVTNQTGTQPVTNTPYLKPAAYFFRAGQP